MNTRQIVILFLKTIKNPVMQKIAILAIITIVSGSVCAQTKVNSSLFSVMEARALGLGTMSGRITAIEGVVADEGKTIYLGSAGGGVWKSTTAGVSWKPVFDKYCQSIGALAVDQKNPQVVYAGTGECNMRNSVSIGDGMYKSTDGGDNWKKIGLDSTEHISKIVINPSNSDEIYVAVPGPLWSNSPNRGLFKSVDAGATWQKILYIDEQTGCADLLIDPANPEILLASTWQFRRTPYSFNSGGNGSGLYKSADGGKTWREIKNGLPSKPFGRIAMCLAPSDPEQMYAIVESNNTGLYISSDGGENWKSQSAPLNIVARPFYFSTIAVDPTDPKRVYRPAFSFSYSSDGGYSFMDAGADGTSIHSDMHAIWINPVHPNIIYVGSDGGVYMSIDKGASWQYIQNLPVAQFYHVAYDLKDPYNVYGGLQDNGSWMAPSAAPGGIGNGRWNMLGWGDGFWAVPDVDGKSVYWESQGGSMNRGVLPTYKAENIQPQKTASEEKLRWNWNTPIVTGANNPHNLYVGAQYLYKSTDQGRNWNRISPDLTTNDKLKQKQEDSGGLSEDNTSAENHCTIFTISESPLDEKVVWVGTDDGNLQFTTDSGKVWTNLSDAVAQCGVARQSWVSSIELSKFDRNLIYVTLDNHMYGDHSTYLVKSIDGGNTWSRINSAVFTGFAHKIKEDTENPNLLFLGTEMGLFAALDGGSNWFRMKNKIPEYALVRDIQIQPRTHDLIIATHGRGIYILDDIRQISQLTPEILDKDVYVFPTPDLVLSQGRFGYGGPNVQGEWAVGNPPFTPPITYYFKNRLSTGKVSIDILDEKGNLVQNIPATIAKGINKVTWNLRETPPRVAAGSTKIDGAGATAPMVLPGVYTVNLKVNDKVYTSKVNCVHDESNKDLNLEQRKLVYEKAHELENVYENINNTLDSIMLLQMQLKSDSVVFSKNKKMKAKYDELQKIKSNLTATKKTSIFADEEKIREQISKLFSTFCGMESAPNSTQLESIKFWTNEFLTQQSSFRKAVSEIKISKVIRN
jgi:photosystem II stability/assembly factor-like uncharacterized protein